MGQIVEEVKIWNTPAIGAFLLWKFTVGYIQGHPTGEAPVALLHFVATGILTNKELIEAINDMRPNLASFVRWFEEQEKTDMLLEIQDRIAAKRRYTLDAIDIATYSGLLAWNTESGKLYPRTQLPDAPKGSGLKNLYKRYGTKAEILGKWFAQLDMKMIATYLKLVF